MRVLYLSYDGLTDPLGQSQVLPYLVGLSAKGHQIDVISFEKSANFERLGSHIREACARHRIGYHPQPYTKKPPVLSTLRDIRRMRAVSMQLLAANNYEIVHCRSYIPALAGHFLQQQKGLKFIFDMRGFYADERVDGGIWPQSNPIYRWVYHYFKRKEKRFLKDADWVVSLTHSAKETIEEWGVRNKVDQISVIPCCVDTHHFDRNAVTSDQILDRKRELDIIQSDPVIGYVGSTGTWYLLREMLLYFREILDLRPAAVMVFLTYDNPETVFSKAAECGISKENIRVKGVDRAVLPAYLATFDWSVFFIQPVFSKKASSPTKLGELLSMGIPVVCNSNVGDTDFVIEKYQAGICLTDTSLATMKSEAEASLRLSSIDRSNLLFGAKEYFSLEKGVEEFDRIYQELGK